MLSKMPQQVWQADDGTVFPSEAEAVRYEESDKLFRLFYDQDGKRKDNLPDIEQLNIRTSIGPHLMQLFVKEFTYLPVAVGETRGLKELGNRLQDLKSSKWLFPNGTP